MYSIIVKKQIFPIHTIHWFFIDYTSSVKGATHGGMGATGLKHSSKHQASLLGTLLLIIFINNSH